MVSPGVYKIKTPNLVIRCYHILDAGLMKKSIDESIEHLKPWMPWAWDEPETFEQKVERIKKFRQKYDDNEDYTMGIFNAEETELMGGTGFHKRLPGNAMEIGYWVNVRHTNKGVITETVKALTQAGFEYWKLDLIEIHCDSRNSASARVPEKCGYTMHELRRGNMEDVYGARRDTMVWQMDSKTYQSTPFIKIPLQGFDLCGNQIDKRY